MFSTSVGHFVKAVGKDSFVPVPSLDLADNVKLLQVVVKKNRFWFWQKPTYKPTDFSLDDLLKDGAKVDLPSKTHVLVEDYNPSYNIAVNGKFGAALCKELIHVEIDADDEIKLDVRFGDVQKTEVDDIPKLVRALDSVQLDLDNPFLRQLRKDSNKTLCIIVGVANLSKDSELSSELKFDNDGEISATVTGRARVSVDDEKTKTFTIPGGTSIAYNVCELLVTTSGTPRLVVIEGLHGGFEAADEADCPRSPALSATDESSVILFKGILTMNPAERASFTADVLDIMATPRLAEPILNQLRAAYRSINNVRNSHSDVMLNFLKRTIVSKKTTWQSILKTAGFGFQADGRVSYPGEDSPRLESCRALFKALCELEDEEIASLRSCDPSLAKPLHNLLHDAILKYPIKTTNERFSPIFSNDNAAVTLLKELGFVIHDSAADPPQENVYSLQAAEKVVFALWGTSDM